MRRTAALLFAVAALTGCQVNVDNQSKRNAEHAADGAGKALGKAADDAGKAIDKGAAKLEKAADAVDAKARKLDVHVNLGGRGDDDGNKAKRR